MKVQGLFQAAVLLMLGMPALGQAVATVPGALSADFGGVRLSPGLPLTGWSPVVSPATFPGGGVSIPPAVVPARIGAPSASGACVSGCPSPGVVCFRQPGAGLRIRGSFDDERFRLKFHLGTSDDRLVCVPVQTAPVLAWWWVGDGWSGQRYSTIYGFYAPTDPKLAGSAAPEQPQEPSPSAPSQTARDRAMEHLRQRDYARAAERLRAWLDEHPQDGEALRALGVALIAGRDVRHGVPTVALAYHTDPWLAWHPLPADVLGTRESLRDVLRRVSMHANEVRSASGWLTLAVLMQAEGRRADAARMLQRARAAGLDTTIERELSAALR